jgi:hypothetical protein
MVWVRCASLAGVLDQLEAPDDGFVFGLDRVLDAAPANAWSALSSAATLTGADPWQSGR